MAKYRSPKDDFDELMKTEDGKRTANFMKKNMSPIFERIQSEADYWGVSAEEQIRKIGESMYDYADERPMEAEEIMNDVIDRSYNRPYPKSNQEMIPEDKSDKTGLADTPQERGIVDTVRERRTGDEGFKRNYNVDPAFRSYDDRARPRDIEKPRVERIKDEDEISRRIFGRDKPRK